MKLSKGKITKSLRNVKQTMKRNKRRPHKKHNRTQRQKRNPLNFHKSSLKRKDLQVGGKAFKDEKKHKHKHHSKDKDGKKHKHKHHSKDKDGTKKHKHKHHTKDKDGINNRTEDVLDSLAPMRAEIEKRRKAENDALSIPSLETNNPVSDVVSTNDIRSDLNKASASLEHLKKTRKHRNGKNKARHISRKRSEEPGDPGDKDALNEIGAVDDVPQNMTTTMNDGIETSVSNISEPIGTDTYTSPSLPTDNNPQQNVPSEETGVVEVTDDVISEIGDDKKENITKLEEVVPKTTDEKMGVNGVGSPPIEEAKIETSQYGSDTKPDEVVSPEATEEKEEAKPDEVVTPEATEEKEETKPDEVATPEVTEEKEEVNPDEVVAPEVTDEKEEAKPDEVVSPEATEEKGDVEKLVTSQAVLGDNSETATATGVSNKVNAPPGAVDTSDVEGKTKEEIVKEIDDLPEKEQNQIVEAETEDEKEERKEFEKVKEDPSPSEMSSPHSSSSVPSINSGYNGLSLDTTLGEIASVLSSGIIKSTQESCMNMNQNGNVSIVKVAQELQSQKGGKRKTKRSSLRLKKHKQTKKQTI